MANIKSVKELILDEQRLVTYVSLSKELCVHVNESKSLLALAVEEIKKKQPDITLNVNFILSGLLNDKSARTLVCSETDLDTEKTKFRTLFFQHIYSVSQSLSGVDNAAIVSVNKLEDFPLCTGLIKSYSCTKRTLDEIGALKTKLAVDAHTSTAPAKKGKLIQNGTDNSVVKAHGTKSAPVIKPEVISPIKDAHATTSISNGKINNSNVKKPTKSIAGFFSKANSAPTIKPSKPAQENVLKKGLEKRKNEAKTEEMDVDDEEVLDKKIKTEPSKNSSHSKIQKTASQKKTIDESEKSKNEVKTEEIDVDVEEVLNKKIKKEPSRNSSLSKIKKTAKVDKKRKRVLHVSDSESDEDPFADNKSIQHESDDEIPPTPLTNTVKITSGILNPKKRRKVVDKTYTDEDGYILTRKEEVYESCSEDEVVIKPEVKFEKENAVKVNKIKTDMSPANEKKQKNSKKKISPPQKGKQSTMMNFFKKV